MEQQREFTVSQVLRVFTHQGKAVVSVVWETGNGKANEISNEPLGNFVNPDGVITAPLMLYFETQNKVLVWNIRGIPDDANQVDISFYGYLSFHRLPVGRLEKLQGTTWQVVSGLQPDSHTTAATRTGNLLSHQLLDLAYPEICMTWEVVVTRCLGYDLKYFVQLLILRFFKHLPEPFSITYNTIRRTFSTFTTSEDPKLARELLRKGLLVTFLVCGRITTLSPIHSLPQLAYEYESEKVKAEFLTWLSGVFSNLFQASAHCRKVEADSSN
jgi:hypothetical protein